MRNAYALGVGSAAQPADAADGLRPPLIGQALGPFRLCPALPLDSFASMITIPLSDLLKLSPAERIQLAQDFGTASRRNSASCLSRRRNEPNWNVAWLSMSKIPPLLSRTKRFALVCRCASAREPTTRLRTTMEFARRVPIACGAFG